MRKLLLIIAVLSMFSCSRKTLWTIGDHDGSAAEFALAGKDFKDYIASDFGFEDRYFLVGESDISKEFQYALPGPKDAWGGTWGGHCWVTHDINILFPLEGKGLSSTTDMERQVMRGDSCRLTVNLLGVSSEGSLVKFSFNGKHAIKFSLAPGVSDTLLYGETSGAKAETLVMDFPTEWLVEGGNTIMISVLEGGWIIFDDLSLETPSYISMTDIPGGAYVRSVEAAGYKLGDSQPLLVDVEHLYGNPEVTVELDKEVLFSQKLDTSRYVFEVPMPLVPKNTQSRYVVKVDGNVAAESSVTRFSNLQEQTPADYVDTRIGSGHSRWMIAPGPWMPFSMVKVSPDNQNTGWQAGYQPSYESIGCFSHIHEWTMAGLGVMPTNGKLYIRPGDESCSGGGYRSRIDKFTEKAPLGKYSVFMEDTGIEAEVTATTRASLMRFVFPDTADARIMVDMHIPAEYEYQLKSVDLKKVSDTRIEGTCHQITPCVWSSDADQDYTLYFVMEFDRKIGKVGCWADDSVMEIASVAGKDLKEAGMYLEFDTKESNMVSVRTGISFVSLKNADLNLVTEISNPFGWDFDAVVQNQKNEWNDILSRIEIKTSDRLEKVRFYTNLFRAHCRNTFSDVNGEWTTPDETLARLSGSDDLALGCDAFWNTFWNLNQVWNLVTPEWSSRWVRSQLALYDASGWLSKGPAGMQYIPVMVGEHEIPQLVSAYQMGIRDYDAEKLYTAIKKMQTQPARRVKGGFVGNRDLIPYLKYHYVPYEFGTFSNSLEYSFDDWTVAQFAKALGKYSDYAVFSDRGTWWKNVFCKEDGYAHVKDKTGKFVDSFDPFNTYYAGRLCYTEGNAWQLSYFVPQDPLGMIETIGKEMFLDHLQWGFSESEQWRFNSPNERYDAYPVVQGNQQSMHFAFLFNWAGKPWLTQKWSRSIIDRYYGVGTGNAYLGDEDQGQMSGWFVMAALGLFQLDGGCSIEPYYEIASPIFEETVINLGERYGRGKTFTIKAEGVSRNAKYIQSATLNGKQLDSFRFPASELLAGGELILKMGTEPNTDWGLL